MLVKPADFSYSSLALAPNFMAVPHHRRLIVTGTEDDGDISLASTLHAPPLDDEQLQWQQQRPSQLRRASSQGAQAGRGGSGHRKRNSTLMRVNDLPTAVLPSELLNRMKEWIETIVIVNFDLDRGPGMLQYWNFSWPPPF